MRKLIAIPATIIIATALFVVCSNRSLAQDKKDDHGNMSGHDMSGHDMHQPSPEEMKKMMEAGNPGPEHQEMMKSAGDWDAEVSFNMGGQWSTPTHGTMHMEAVLGGRFLMMKYDGVMNMGGGDMPFQGMGISGYDNVKKKYFSTWIDSMSTSMMKTEGTKEGNVVTLTGKIMDATMSKEVGVKEVVTHVDADHMNYEMYTVDANGKEMKMMTIKYTRKS